MKMILRSRVLLTLLWTYLSHLYLTVLYHPRYCEILKMKLTCLTLFFSFLYIFSSNANNNQSSFSKYNFIREQQNDPDGCHR